MIRVLVVESVTWMGDLLSDVLASAPEVMITARASNVDGALKSVNKSDVVLVNTALAHDNAIQRIKKANPRAHLVALDLAGDEPDLFRCLEMGVSGCVGKEDSVQDLLTLVRAAHQRPGSRLPRMASAIISQVSRRAEERPVG